MADAHKLDGEEKEGNRAPEVLSLHDAPAAVLSEDTLDPVYAAKARVLNKAIQDIGMGRYQWQVSSNTLLAASRSTRRRKSVEAGFPPH
jgi:hypothetical protein